MRQDDVVCSSSVNHLNRFLTNDPECGSTLGPASLAECRHEVQAFVFPNDIPYDQFGVALVVRGHLQTICVSTDLDRITLPADEKYILMLLSIGKKLEQPWVQPSL
jgi:hypothetical protein